MCPLQDGILNSHIHTLVHMPHVELRILSLVFIEDFLAYSIELAFFDFHLNKIRSFYQK